MVVVVVVISGFRPCSEEEEEAECVFYVSYMHDTRRAGRFLSFAMKRKEASDEDAGR